MELELSLGDSPAPAKATVSPAPATTGTGEGEGHELVLKLGVRIAKRAEQDYKKTGTQPEEAVEGEDDEAHPRGKPPVELSLSCPLVPASAQTGSANSEVCTRGFDVNAVPVDGGAATARSLSPSSMQAEVPARRAADPEATEEEENGGGAARKKLRLSKEQSAFLEDSFKEHNTLTPKQKRDLANRLNLRPRQVEVWFQNRRARTKLKQTEVDCEYLKRCCETLTQENRRLQREVAELRAFRTTYPLYNHHLSGVSTALRVCQSCDNKLVTTAYSPPIITTPAVTAASSPVGAPPPSSMFTLFARPHFGPFTIHPVLRRQPSATS